jgi:hypothetical protein
MENQLGIAPLFLALAIYVFFSYCLVTLAKKLGDDRPWWGWIPIMQVLLMLRIAGLTYWWILGLLVPLVNIAVAIFVWIRIAQRRQKPAWVGVLMIVPGLDLFVLGFLAFSK